MSPGSETRENQATRLTVVEMISWLLVSTDPRDLGRRLTEELRELTGARTVLLLAHRGDSGAPEMLRACPERRAALFSPEEIHLFRPGTTPDPLPRRTVEIPEGNPLRAVLEAAGVESVLRFPLRTGGELLGVLLLLDLPDLDRVDEPTEIISLLSPPIALALRNAFAAEQIEKQRQEIQGYARALEHRVAERTAELAAMNNDLVASRLAALNMIEDAVEARDRAEQASAALRREVEERRQAQEALRESEEHYRSLFENMLNGFAYCRMLYDETGRPEDFVYLSVNAAFETLTGLRNVEGRRASEVIPGIREADPMIIEIYGRVASTGEPVRFEQRLSSLDMWFSISVYSPSKEYFVAVFDVITERKRAEEALRESEERFRTLVEQAGDGFELVDPSGRYVDVNGATCLQLGYSREELLHLSIQDIDPVMGKDQFEAIFQTLVGSPPQTFETVHRRKDGTVFPVEVKASVIHLGGALWGLSLARDITERKRAEEEREHLHAQLAQAQKMESVGRLAGGVAHDFNNMLTVILGHAELALGQVSSAEPLYADLEAIEKAADRSADLTRQLLAFARKQTIAPRVLDLNDTVAGMLKMLRRLIGEDIDLAWIPGADLWPVKIDPSQIDQLLANLCVNARDAIAGAGRVTIETGNVTFDEAWCADHADALPGAYVMLAVSDDGRGMDKEVLEHLFEPFFTTKVAGEGTGLGLATVHGIVKQNEGFLNVYSEPGMGTTFKIYLNRCAGEVAETRAAGVDELPESRGEAVLLVEDEEAILRLVEVALERLGYTVLTAGTPDEAMHQAQTHAGEIDLLITDVVMPGMNGRELAERLTVLRPNLRCLFMSGYTADVIAHRGVLDEGVQFLQKPFVIKDLATKVRDVLDRDR